MFATVSRWESCFSNTVMILESQRTSNGARSISVPVSNVQKRLLLCSLTLSGRLYSGIEQSGPCWAHFLPGLQPAFLVSRALVEGNLGKGMRWVLGLSFRKVHGKEADAGVYPIHWKRDVAGFHSPISWPVSPPAIMKMPPLFLLVLSYRISFCSSVYLGDKMFYPCHRCVLSENTLNYNN